MIFSFLNFLKTLFSKQNGCCHEHVRADETETYCPDCGALIQNKWFIIRCRCCGIKRAAHIVKDDIAADAKFCTNCGASEYYIQELDKLNYTDIRYAVYKKFIVNQPAGVSYTQVWTEETAENGIIGNALPILK